MLTLPQNGRNLVSGDLKFHFFFGEGCHGTPSSKTLDSHEKWPEFRGERSIIISTCVKFKFRPKFFINMVAIYMECTWCVAVVLLFLEQNGDW